MSAQTSVGTVRTYARIADGEPFTYANWMRAVRSGNTFVTYGPLMDFAVEGKPAGSRIRMRPSRRHRGHHMDTGQRDDAHEPS